MKAIILAAGRGSRMNELTYDKPKCLIEINGKTLLDWQLEAIKSVGINEIGIVTGYKREMLSVYKLIEFYNPNWETSQMVYSLNYATNWLEKSTCIVSYSDILYDSSAIQSIIDSDDEINLTYDVHWEKLWRKRFEDPLVDAETFRLNYDGSLAEIGKKPKSISDIEGQFMGLLKFTPNGWEKLKEIFDDLQKEEIKKLHMTDILQMLIESNKARIMPTPYKKFWGEFDSIKDIESI